MNSYRYKPKLATTAKFATNHIEVLHQKSTLMKLPITTALIAIWLVILTVSVHESAVNCTFCNAACYLSVVICSWAEYQPKTAIASCFSAVFLSFQFKSCAIWLIMIIFILAKFCTAIWNIFIFHIVGLSRLFFWVCSTTIPTVLSIC